MFTWRRFPSRAAIWLRFSSKVQWPDFLLPGLMISPLTSCQARYCPTAICTLYQKRGAIAEGLRNGILRPSLPPTGMGFFFVKEKDGGLRPVSIIGGLTGSRTVIRSRSPPPPWTPFITPTDHYPGYAFWIV